MSIQKGVKPAIQHRSVGALLAAYPGERDAEKLIKRLARTKVAYAKNFGWSGPPFCPLQFSSLFKVRCKEVAHDIGGDGRILLNRAGKPEIEYKKEALPERQRFTIFHEFAHMLFPDYCEFLPHHHTPEEIESLEHRQFENLCDAAASEMLFPLEEFTADLKKYSRPGLGAIEELRQRYLASIDATTHRLIELTPQNSCSAVFLTDQKGRHEGEGPLWAKYSKKTPAFNCFIWPGTCPPKDSVAIKCFEGTDSFKAVREVWSVKGQKKAFLVQAAKLPMVVGVADYAKVVVLLFPA